MKEICLGFLKLLSRSFKFEYLQERYRFHFFEERWRVSCLSSLLKTLTGHNTQQHIHEKLIEKAKEKLTCTPLSVSEIAYELGFEHLQSFSKVFKLKTKLSPSEFRHSFN